MENRWTAIAGEIIIVAKGCHFRRQLLRCTDAFPSGVGQIQYFLLAVRCQICLLGWRFRCNDMLAGVTVGSPFSSTANELGRSGDRDPSDRSTLQQDVNWLINHTSVALFRTCVTEPVALGIGTVGFCLAAFSRDPSFASTVGAVVLTPAASLLTCRAALAQDN